MCSICWPFYPPVETVYIEIPFTYGDILDTLFIDMPFRVQRIENNKLRVISDSPDFKKNIEDYVKSIGYGNYISINDYYVDLSYSTGNYVYELFLNEVGIEKFNELCTVLQLQGKLSKKYRTKYV